MTEQEKAFQEKLSEERRRMSRLHTRDKVALIAKMREKFGDEVLDIVTQHAGEAARQGWARVAARHGSNSIEDLVRLLWEPMKASGLGFEYTSEERDGGLQMRCTKCYIHELGKELGAPEIIYALNCATDPYLVEGFNPKIGFRRTKTLLDGYDCCDHFYYMKEE